MIETDGIEDQTANYSSLNEFTQGMAIVRFRMTLIYPHGTSERFCGLGLTDFTRLVCIHLSGDTVEFITKDGAGTETHALSDDLFSDFHEYEIIWQTEACYLYIDRTLKATSTTHIPDDDLKLVFAGQKI